MKKIFTIKIKESSLRNFSGFSLLEVIVAMGISSSVILAAFAIANFSKKSTDKSVSQMEEFIQKKYTERILTQDIQAGINSLNNLVLPAQEGGNFFDFTVTARCKTNCQRTFRIQNAEPGTEPQSFYLITTGRHTIRYPFSPAIAFNYDQSVPDAPLVYRGINANLPGIMRDEEKGIVTAWEKNVPVILTSDAFINDPTDSLPKQLFMLGQVNPEGTDISPGLKLGEVAALLPRNNTNPENFLRSIPFTDGIGSVVFLESFIIVRYQIKGGTLYRSTSKISNNQLSFEQDQLIGTHIKEMILQRSSINSGVISFDLIQKT